MQVVCWSPVEVIPLSFDIIRIASLPIMSRLVCSQEKSGAKLPKPLNNVTVACVSQYTLNRRNLMNPNGHGWWSIYWQVGRVQEIECHSQEGNEKKKGEKKGPRNSIDIPENLILPLITLTNMEWKLAVFGRRMDGRDSYRVIQLSLYKRSAEWRGADNKPLSQPLFIN